jgi:small subunit ribosomal protein S2e
MPVTKLGRLVKDGKIASIEDIYRFSLPIKEYQIIDYFFPKLVDEVVKITPVQKQTQAGQRTRFKAYVIVGDCAGHVGLGVKCAKEVATAIRGAIIAAKLSIIPIRMGYWGNIIGQPHTVPAKVSGRCGSVLSRLVPAPRGTGLVCSPTIKRLLELAGIKDVYTTAAGKTRTRGNFIRATFEAIGKTFEFKTPDMWGKDEVKDLPYQEHSDYLAQAKEIRVASRRS